MTTKTRVESVLGLIEKSRELRKNIVNKSPDVEMSAEASVHLSFDVGKGKGKKDMSSHMRRFCYGVILAMTAFTCSTLPARPAGRELQFDGQGKFKIVQFTDIHWKHGSPECQAVLQIMASVLDAEQPDLVILTGDIVTTQPAREGWNAVVRPMIRRKIHWAVTLGNHDDEQDLDRTEIISLLEKQPYSVVEAGPTNIDGEGNYILKLKGSKKQNVAVIYCIDSLAYAPEPEETNGTYAWNEPSQVKWYRENSLKITKANHGRPLPSLAFFHIPLPEFNAAWNNKSFTPIGTKGEEVCCPKKNTGMFSAMVDSRDIMGVFVGHDHDNDYAGYLQRICLAYGRTTGLDTYGELQTGARVIELKEGKTEFDTWLRTGDGKIQHEVHYPTSFIEPRAQQNGQN